MHAYQQLLVPNSHLSEKWLAKVVYECDMIDNVAHNTDKVVTHNDHYGAMSMDSLQKGSMSVT